MPQVEDNALNPVERHSGYREAASAQQQKLANSALDRLLSS